MNEAEKSIQEIDRAIETFLRNLGIPIKPPMEAFFYANPPEFRMMLQALSDAPEGVTHIIGIEVGSSVKVLEKWKQLFGELSEYLKVSLIFLSDVPSDFIRDVQDLDERKDLRDSLTGKMPPGV